MKNLTEYLLESLSEPNPMPEDKNDIKAILKWFGYHDNLLTQVYDDWDWDHRHDRIDSPLLGLKEDIEELTKNTELQKIDAGSKIARVLSAMIYTAWLGNVDLKYVLEHQCKKECWPNLEPYREIINKFFELKLDKIYDKKLKQYKLNPNSNYIESAFKYWSDKQKFVQDKLRNKISPITPEIIPSILQGSKEDTNFLKNNAGWDQKYINLLKTHAGFIDFHYPGPTLIDIIDKKDVNRLKDGRAKMNNPIVKKIISDSTVKNLTKINNIKSLGIYWIDDYESPLLIAFDISNPDVDKILDNIKL